jgi:hypothetical protein
MEFELEIKQKVSRITPFDGIAKLIIFYKNNHNIVQLFSVNQIKKIRSFARKLN